MIRQSCWLVITKHSDATGIEPRQGDSWQALQGNDPCQLRSHVGNQLGGTSGGWTKWPGGCQVEGCQVGPLRVVLQPRVIILTCRLCRL